MNSSDFYVDPIELSFCLGSRKFMSNMRIPQVFTLIPLNPSKLEFKYAITKKAS